MKVLTLTALNLLFTLFESVRSEIRDVSTPSLPPTVKESSRGFTHFLNLWEYSLRTDNKFNQREDIDPKTLLLPGDSSMAHLVPQDAFHPLYGGSKYAQMRQEFIFDHLVLDPIPVENADKGIGATTLSGKDVFIQKDASGKLTVNGVQVLKMVSLEDTYFIYILKAPLFNQTMKVRQAFQEIHNTMKEDDPVGPPLDIPEGPLPPPIPSGPSVVRAPAPPLRASHPPAPLQNPSNISAAASPSSSSAIDNP